MGEATEGRAGGVSDVPGDVPGGVLRADQGVGVDAATVYVEPGVTQVMGRQGQHARSAAPPAVARSRATAALARACHRGPAASEPFRACPPALPGRS